MPEAKILIVDDEASICWGLANLCKEMSFAANTASSAEKGLELANQEEFDLVIMDVRLPGIDGISAIRKFKAVDKDLPIITITAFGELQTAVNAIQNGAFEYIVKPFDLNKVKETIQQAVAARRMAHSVAAKISPNELAATPSRLIGSSALMQEVFKQIAVTTTSDAPVLITGEQGTGKELTARSIHQFGPTNPGPFIHANVSAIPTSNMEEHFFGSEATTGAFADAAGGTLFVDDIGDIPIEFQFKLFRALEDGQYSPVGSELKTNTDFRLITATHQDLLSQINHGDFRHDLFYCLRTFEIKMPPLRLRKEDIPELVSAFLQQPGNGSQTATDEFISKLQSRTWQGNVRELHSVVERAMELARGGILTAEHVSLDETASPVDTRPDTAQQLKTNVAEWTRQHWNDEPDVPLYDSLLSIVDSAILPEAFRLSENQYSSAARRLGIHRTTLKKKLDEMSADSD